MMKTKEKLINPPKDMTDRTFIIRCEAVTAVMTQTNAQDYYLFLDVSTKKSYMTPFGGCGLFLWLYYRAALTLDFFIPLALLFNSLLSPLSDSKCSKHSCYKRN